MSDNAGDVNICCACLCVGFLCPVHTPDGAPCGLLNHLSANAQVCVCVCLRVHACLSVGLSLSVCLCMCVLCVHVYNCVYYIIALVPCTHR